MRRGQVSVPLDPEQRAYVERVAEEQDRSIAAVLRRMVSDAMRAQAAPSERSVGR